MSEGFSDPLFVLLGALGSAFCGAIIWVCKHKCRNVEVDCSSGCCRLHGDSRLRQTVREEIQSELQKSQSTEDLEENIPNDTD